MENDINGYGYDTRAYGLGNLGSLSPLLGMGSSLAGYMGHNNVAKMLGQANGLMGTFSKHFPNGLGSGSFGGLGGPFNPGIQPGFGGQGYPFSGAQGQGFGMPFGPQSSGFGGLAGLDHPILVFKAAGLGIHYKPCSALTDTAAECPVSFKSRFVRAWRYKPLQAFSCDSSLKLTFLNNPALKFSILGFHSMPWDGDRVFMFKR